MCDFVRFVLMYVFFTSNFFLYNFYLLIINILIVEIMHQQAWKLEMMYLFLYRVRLRFFGMGETEFNCEKAEHERVSELNSTAIN